MTSKTSSHCRDCNLLFIALGLTIKSSGTWETIIWQWFFFFFFFFGKNKFILLLTSNPLRSNFWTLKNLEKVINICGSWLIPHGDKALYNHRYIWREVVYFFLHICHWFEPINILGYLSWITKYKRSMVLSTHSIKY